MKYSYYYPLFLLLLVGCIPLTGAESAKESSAVSQITITPISAQPLATEPSVSAAPVTIETMLLAKTERPCTGHFAVHPLDHTTTVPGGNEVRMFEANGGGVAINDLDNDGDLDIVLANHAGPNTILWNEGDLNFQTERIAAGDSRAANIVDVDGDGWLDIIFSRRASAPNFWRNEGGRQFSLTVLPGVDKPIYAINWGDLDGDHDLDFVGGTYDASLLADLGTEFLMSGKAGVYIYENQGGKYKGTRLAGQAQALALALLDLNQDDRLDILVGNDFELPDYAWVRQGEGWLETKSFGTTSYSTMSLDAGDVNNDGQLEIFSTDMKPYHSDVKTLATWLPLMDDMYHTLRENDPQRAENMLQVRDPEGRFRNQAYIRNLDATGWSWTGKFGDLDNDGFLDLYVVNGMIEAGTFDYLPNHELVEQNQALHNDGAGNFVDAPEWGLGSSLSGRGMSMADLDQDGDLDIVVNNLRAPAELFENQLCGGASLEVDLFWPESKNTRALATRLALHTSVSSYYRDVRAASGYLSGDPARVHFGFPAEARLNYLEIHWPDGAISKIEALTPGTLLRVTRQ